MQAICSPKSEGRIGHNLRVKVECHPYQKGEGPVGLNKKWILKNQFSATQNFDKHVIGEQDNNSAQQIIRGLIVLFRGQ